MTDHARFRVPVFPGSADAMQAIESALADAYRIGRNGALLCQIHHLPHEQETDQPAGGYLLSGIVLTEAQAQEIHAILCAVPTSNQPAAGGCHGCGTCEGACHG